MRDTVRSFSIVTVFSVATRLMSFLFKIWMSRTLGAEAVGLYQIAFSVLLLLFSCVAGAPTVLSRKIAECAARGEVRRQNALTSASLLIGLVSSLAVCVLFFALSSRLGGIFADERCVPIFLTMLPALVTSSVYAPLRSWFWGREPAVARELLRAGLLRIGVRATRPQLEDFRRAILGYAPGRKFNLPGGRLVELGRDSFIL